MVLVSENKHLQNTQYFSIRKYKYPRKYLPSRCVTVKVLCLLVLKLKLEHISTLNISFSLTGDNCKKKLDEYTGGKKIKTNHESCKTKIISPKNIT